MIINFNIFEKLGYSDEVKQITNYVWSYYKNHSYNYKKDFVINLSDFTKNFSIKINKLIIKFVDVSDDYYNMLILYDYINYEKTKNIILKQNINVKKNITNLEHEIKHAYDFIKSKGNSGEESSTGYNYLESEIDYIKNLIYIMYVIDKQEIKGYYQQIVRYYMENKNRFKNFDDFIKHSRLYSDYLNLKNFDVDKYKDIDNKELDALINTLRKVKNELYVVSEYGTSNIYKIRLKQLLHGNLNFNFKLNKYNEEYSKEQIDVFFNRIKKNIEFKKKLILDYLGKLYAYFH